MPPNSSKVFCWLSVLLKKKEKEKIKPSNGNSREKPDQNTKG